ncbi:glycosyltransferase family 4 protein [Mucilaginibacter sp. HC2]|uniref:glycosyltransferase family 4 protein n=1 Tax=Mucilaginibacter inviolabilis TaxID=2714892 RepID=UPI001407A418|nr:glycosyltransferase family 4 protein [Mucilaginibacter inviolabilis]NHA04449.1 glycosyltransferase family 4 protein [Mucilaginibacter inviolabilis]
MKILIVDELCYPQLGGQQVRFKELAEEWVKSGNEVEIAAIDHIGNSPVQEYINGVKYSRIISNANYYKNGRFGRDVGTIVKFSFKLHRHFKGDWDAIIFNQFPMLPSLFYKWFYKKRSKTIVDFVEHRNSKLWRFINSQILNATDAVVCISKHVKSCVKQYRENNLHVIPSLVDTSLAQSLKKENYIFLGRLEEHKHPEHAIEAVLNYNQQFGAKRSLHIMGSGNLYNNLNQQYGSNDYVVFHGLVNGEEKDKVFQQARLLLLPSEREGLPKVVIEAMAYGIPTLTTNYAGNGTQYFVKEEEIGEVAEPNIDALAKKINQIESDYKTYSDKCMQIKGEFDLHLNSIKYLNILQ